MESTPTMAPMPPIGAQHTTLASPGPTHTTWCHHRCTQAPTGANPRATMFHSPCPHVSATAMSPRHVLRAHRCHTHVTSPYRCTTGPYDHPTCMFSRYHVPPALLCAYPC